MASDTRTNVPPPGAELDAAAPRAEAAAQEPPQAAAPGMMREPASSVPDSGLPLAARKRVADAILREMEEAGLPAPGGPTRAAVPPEEEDWPTERHPLHASALEP